MSETYDSRPDTREHIRLVQKLLEEVVVQLRKRSLGHDRSKLVTPEVEVFDEFTPKLNGATYMSAEYQACLVGMGVALRHHYARNRHHPEHFENGVNDMNLIDLIEMFCDWWASSLRHKEGSIRQSIAGPNAERFGLSEQLVTIFLNTVEALEPSGE